ncbi:triose-phosphate isomerase [Candidatus Nomurabacteria bacterium]|nr:triose-phosphate isomerase [Candidatus Nomurabacteria bacterium]
MEKKIVIGNWKMKLTVEESVKQAKQLKKLVTGKLAKSVDIGIAPDFLSLPLVSQILKNTGVKLGAQDAWSEDFGSFTSQISPVNLKYFSCHYLILAHSERRQFAHEDYVEVNKKIITALKNDLTPVLCVGETFDERKEGRKDLVIMQQVQTALKGVDIKPEQNLIIAYEPVWAIGSGQATQPEEARHTALIIKQSLIDVLEGADLPLVKILYGGSVTPENIESFVKTKEIDGALVGGASLEAGTFIELIKKSVL